MSNPIEELLKKLINDPALLKSLEKMASESVKLSLKERQRKREIDRFGTLDYLISCDIHCKLCGSTQRSYSPMIWDKIEKLHRAACFSEILRDEWTCLTVKSIKQLVPTCKFCETNLVSLPKDELIKKLVFHASK